MAKQIIGLAQQGDIWRAIQIANHGRELCTVETILEQYYYKLANLEHSMNKPSGMRGNPSDEAIFKRDAERELKSGKNAICKIFIEAVNTYDGAKILEIAKAVWFLRKSGVAIRGGEDFVRADNERYLLLFLKDILSMTGGKMTIRQVAEYVAMDKTVGSSEDGFSALRRKCQAIGFPLQESRKTSQKNRLNVLTKTDFVCHILLKVMRTIKQSAVQAVSDCIA